MGGMVMKMTWALAVVAGLILILYGLARKKMGYTNSPTSRIKVLEMRPLMPKNTLALVEVEKKQVLLGISPSGIQMLAELPTANTAQKPFKDVLQENER
ncbi:MAG: flagellar biosynthetic protein FliO [Desulfobulbus propionicus]|nr:MAG: flagellar biosynthetic protein FliO [Desulfobulbus propionicus]PIE65847.1 MAG: flagellar biosynthetic protein FliO [Desulfobacterales bacterium]